MVSAKLSLVLCLFTLYSTFAIEVPDFIEVCQRNDPELDDCITRSVENLRPYLTQGVPEYNIPSLEPLLLKELVAAEGTGIKVTAKDIHAYGASNFRVKKMKVDLNVMKFNVDVELVHLYITGMYEVEGKVLLLPITGSGPMRINVTDVIGSCKIQAELKKDGDGKDHAHIVEFRMKVTIGKGSLQLDNLFGGDRALGDVINNAINNNFDAFMRELQPLIEGALAEAFLEISNNIISPFTVDQLFP